MSNPRVLFVCTGNTCRSPMAEGIFRDLASKENVELEAASAGLDAMDNMPPNPKSIKAMEKRGIDISHQLSQMLTPQMVEDFNFIFGMGKGHVSTIRTRFPKLRKRPLSSGNSLLVKMARI